MATGQLPFGRNEPNFQIFPRFGTTQLKKVQWNLCFSDFSVPWALEPLGPETPKWLKMKAKPRFTWAKRQGLASHFPVQPLLEAALVLSQKALKHQILSHLRAEPIF
jgi:hypothetical protein